MTFCCFPVFLASGRRRGEREGECAGKIFHFRVDPYLQGRQTTVDRLALLKVYPFPYPCVDNFFRTLQYYGDKVILNNAYKRYCYEILKIVFLFFFCVSKSPIVLITVLTELMSDSVSGKLAGSVSYSTENSSPECVTISNNSSSTNHVMS